MRAQQQDEAERHHPVRQRAERAGAEQRERAGRAQDGAHAPGRRAHLERSARRAASGRRPRRVASGRSAGRMASGWHMRARRQRMLSGRCTARGDCRDELPDAPARDDRNRAVLGLAVTIYLTVVHYAGISVLCSSKGNPCEPVQASVYSKVLGIPVALLGLIGYVGILGALLAPETELPRLATLALTLFGFGFSAYLTYREVFTLKEICEWCVSSAIMLTLLFLLAAWRYIAAAVPAPRLAAVDPASVQQHAHRAREDAGIERERAVLDVVDVELDPLRPRQRRPAVDLRPAGDARLDLEAPALALGVVHDLLGDRGPRPDRATSRRAARSPGSAARPARCAAATRRRA